MLSDIVVNGHALRPHYIVTNGDFKIFLKNTKMPVLSNADLLCEVRKIMDSTINEKFREFNHQFDSKIENKLENVISELQKMKINNEQLARENAMLTTENERLQRELETTSNTSESESCVSADSGKLNSTGDDHEVQMPEPAHGIASRSHVNCLLLSDSIYRHVGTSCPKKRGDPRGAAIMDTFKIGPCSVVKCVVPGATCARLWAEAAFLQTKHTFDHVIVHVGANYIPHHSQQRKPFSKLAATNEIIEFLGELSNLTDSHITFSAIIPQRPYIYLQDILDINRDVRHLCNKRGYGYLSHSGFCSMSSTESLLAYDGVHLGPEGISAITSLVKAFIINEYEVEDTWY